MSINWSPTGQYLIPIPNHPGVKLAESTHLTSFYSDFIASLLSNRCQVWKNVTYIGSGEKNDCDDDDDEGDSVTSLDKESLMVSLEAVSHNSW